MKGQRNTAIKKIISTLCLIVFVAFLLISFSTLHIHELTDGRTVVHSHLANDTNGNSAGDDAGHSHSEIEFLFYSLISVDNLSFNLFVLSLLISLFFISFLKREEQNFNFFFTPFSFNLRAPPIS